MSYAALKSTAKKLSDDASFLVEVTNNDEYEQALALMDELIDDYDNQQVLIKLHRALGTVIELCRSPLQCRLCGFA